MSAEEYVQVISSGKAVITVASLAILAVQVAQEQRALSAVLAGPVLF
jgi:hypothetical protein